MSANTPPMRYRNLGNSGVQVSAIGLGGNTFGRACNAAQTERIVHHALDIGINHFDCADTYGGGGLSEELLGRALRDYRYDAIVATKTGYPFDPGPHGEGLARRRIMAMCNESLQRLGMDHIDIYYLHRPDPHTPIEASLRALDDLIRAGKVRYAGVSNYPGWEIARITERSHARGWDAPIVSQSHFSMLSRSVAQDITPALQAYEMGFIPFSPLAGGLLTGKYRNGDAPAGTRAHGNARFERLLQPDVLAVIGQLEQFADDNGWTLTELALGWLLHQPQVSSVIAGVTSPAQVDANAGAARVELTTVQLAQIDTIVAGLPAGLDL